MSPLSRMRGRARVGAVALVAVVALLSAGKEEAAGQILALELLGRDAEGRPSASGPWSTK